MRYFLETWIYADKEHLVVGENELYCVTFEKEIDSVLFGILSGSKELDLYDGWYGGRVDFSLSVDLDIATAVLSRTVNLDFVEIRDGESHILSYVKHLTNSLWALNGINEANVEDEPELHKYLILKGNV